MRRTLVELRFGGRRDPAAVAGLYDLKRNGISRRTRIHAERPNNPNKKHQGFLNNTMPFGFSA